jgi:hypothetical protein
MATPDLARQVQEALSTDPETFEAAVRKEVEVVTEAVEAGTFNNPQAIVGMEHELFGVDDTTDELVRIPRDLLRYVGFTRELGLHQAETHTSPQSLNRHGLAAQEAELQARITAAERPMRREGYRLVSAGLTVPSPAGETMSEYLPDTATVDGVRVAANMSDAVRYHAMSNAGRAGYEPRMELDAPHVSRQFDTVIPESLICSIQPHFQVANAEDLPEQFRYALRIAAPVTALTANSPFFPPDLYDDVPAEAVIEDSHMENRIGVFESALNAEDAQKVCFPPDVETCTEAVEHIAADRTIVPMTVETEGRFDDRWRHLRHKHGSYWRWVRPVFEAPTEKDANARIEFRPVPAQPTARDCIGVLALFAGLMASLPRRAHPLYDLDWEQARENFYAATRDGLRAEMEYIDSDGERTSDAARIYADLFEHAYDGLETHRIDRGTAAAYLEPLRRRVERGVTPARWTVERARERVADGASLEEAVHGAHCDYVDRQQRTLVEGSFVDWLD